MLADPELTIELVASEPEVASPVAIAWDEEGRLFVAEMLDYPTATTSGRIRMLEDRDGDGRYEHATVFADGLPFPNGVLPCFGGVLVTAAPNIWFLRDSDGDGRADERRVVLTGFGEGNTQLRVNGLYWGLDNRIYAANGRSDGEVREPDRAAEKAVSIRRRDLRFRLACRGRRPGRSADARPVEAIAGFSQFGLPHDDWGNRFPSWNTIPIRHVVLEQQALDRNPYLAETSSVASILDLADGGRIFAISPPQARFNRESVAFFNASCGPLIERGGLAAGRLPRQRLRLRAADEPGAPARARTGRRDVHRPPGRAGPRVPGIDPTRPSGRSTWRTARTGRSTSSTCTANWSSIPSSCPNRRAGSVDFRRWHDRGRIWRIRPSPRRHHAVAASGPGQGQRARARRAARDSQRLVAHDGAAAACRAPGVDAAVPLLIACATSRTTPKPLARLHALWTLDGIELGERGRLESTGRRPAPGPARARAACPAAIESQQRTVCCRQRSLVAAGRRPRDPRPAPGRAGAGRSLSRRARPPWMPWDGSPPGTRPTPGCGWRSSAAWPSRRWRSSLLCDQIPPVEAVPSSWRKPPRSWGSPPRPRTGRAAGDDRVDADGMGRSWQARPMRSTR